MLLNELYISFSSSVRFCSVIFSISYEKETRHEYDELFLDLFVTIFALENELNRKASYKKYATNFDTIIIIFKDNQFFVASKEAHTIMNRKFKRIALKNLINCKLFFKFCALIYFLGLCSYHEIQQKQRLIFKNLTPLFRITTVSFLVSIFLNLPRVLLFKDIVYSPTRDKNIDA